MNRIHSEGGQPSNSSYITKSLLLASRIARSRNLTHLADSALGRAWKLAKAGDDRTAMLFGNMSLRNGDTQSAVDAFGEAVNISPNNTDALYKLGFSLERQGNWESADAEYAKAQALDGNSGKIAFRRGRCLSSLGELENAVAQYHLAIRCNHRAADAYAAIYDAEKKSPMWKRLETLRAGSSARADDVSWLRDRASLAAKMGCYAEAVQYFKAVAQSFKISDSDKVELAHCYELLGQFKDSDSLLDEVASKDSGAAKQLGPGIYYKNRGLWREAIRQYHRQLSRTEALSIRASLQFEVGHAYDRQYLWEDAREWFNRSVMTDGEHAYRHYRLGVVLERLGDNEGSASAYARALLMDAEKEHWWYRLAEVARQLDRVDDAYLAYVASLGARDDAEPSKSSYSDNVADKVETTRSMLVRIATDHASALARSISEEFPTEIRTWRQIARAARSLDQPDQEFVALHELSRRLMHPSRSETTRYAELQAERGSIDLALEELRSSRDVRFPDGLDLKRYLNSAQGRRRSLYAEFYETLPIIDNIVFLESNHGASIGCHPLALFREMKQDPRFDGFTFVWAHAKSVEIPLEVSSSSDVILVETHSDLYLKYLATSKYLVNNVSFGPYFVRRAGQTYLNTWHGTPLKTLGQSMKQGLLEYENLARNFVQATHVTSPNGLTDWALFDDHRIARYATAARRITGSPRLDRLINGGADLRKDVRRQLGVDDTESVILYAPTWRGGVSEQTFDLERLISDLQAMSDATSSRVFFRAHRLTEKLVANLTLPVEIVPAEIDTNDLLAGVDSLITDYSSIAFDFLITGRPIVFYVPDIDSYITSRGLYLDPSDFPGHVCADRESLVQTVQQLDAGWIDSKTSMVEAYAPHEDGHASKRALDFMLESAPARLRQRPLLVFHASLMRNGIASALLALLYALDPEKVDIVLVVEGHVMRRDEDRQSVLSRLPDYVDLAFRVGGITATPEEQWAIARANNRSATYGSALKRLTKRAWNREARRVLGGTVPHAAIEFDGYATLWADFIANVGDKSTKHFIWQHNQLVREWRTKYPELAPLFKRYDDYDAVVPVAKSLADENQTELELAGFSCATPYAPVSNVLDKDRILDSSSERLEEDLETWITGGAINIVSIGRLSPEKNFMSLVNAWPAIIGRNPGARLTIIGSGLLEAELKAKARELGVRESIMFAGQRANPYPALKAADLFVLPSTHEGQPVVVLEAMTLDTPVAAAYTPGTAELMEIGYGRIISAHSSEMADDINDLIKNLDDAHGEFSADDYRSTALKQFHEVVFAADR